MKVCEIFHSIQGEGAMIGAPTIFIRMTGCNLSCKWCDTEYAKTEGEEMGLGQVLDEVQRYDCRRVCITGGEPLCQADAVLNLIDELLMLDYFVILETNGSHSLESMECSPGLMLSMDIKCPSSGQQDNMLFSNIELLGPTDQLKFIISDRKDYEHAKNIIEEYDPQCLIIMTPVGGTGMLKELAEWILEDRLNVSVLPQLHKIIWGDERTR